MRWTNKTEEVLHSCCFVGIQRRGSCRSRTNINVEYVFGGNPAGESDEPFWRGASGVYRGFFENIAALAAK